MPALAPVMSAHFPDHVPATDGFPRCDKNDLQKNLLLLSRTKNGVFETTAFVFEALHQAARPDKLGGE